MRISTYNRMTEALKGADCSDDVRAALTGLALQADQLRERIESTSASLSRALDTVAHKATTEAPTGLASRLHRGMTDSLFSDIADLQGAHQQAVVIARLTGGSDFAITIAKAVQP